MGSSGAGKTTLLDVLAGRKNTGEELMAIYYRATICLEFDCDSDYASNDTAYGI
jgi:ABC-type lipoprotein export system ATPase subunit